MIDVVFLLLVFFMLAARFGQADQAGPDLGPHRVPRGVDLRLRLVMLARQRPGPEAVDELHHLLELAQQARQDRLAVPGAEHDGDAAPRRQLAPVFPIARPFPLLVGDLPEDMGL